MNKEQIQKEIEDLQKQRNEFSKKIGELQQQIDSKILKLKNIPDFKNKYIHYEDKELDNNVYMYVKLVDRLHDELKLSGDGINILDDEFIEIMKDFNHRINYDNTSKIVEITQDEFNNIVRNKTSNIIDKIILSHK